MLRTKYATPFAEEIRLSLAVHLLRFVGEPITVLVSLGRKQVGVHTGRITEVHRHGFLMEGDRLGTRSFFSFVDLFAGHAKVADGPAAHAVQATLASLRLELADLAPGRSVQREAQASA
ncbi:MAG: hypothetical protein M0Z66_05245 [Thermaerobacter sp.]|nr:hypothetical protein [Thermaerobacter sp.]